MAFSGHLEDRIAVQALNAACGDTACRKDEGHFAQCFAESATWYLPWCEPVTGEMPSSSFG